VQQNEFAIILLRVAYCYSAPVRRHCRKHHWEQL